MNNTIRKKQATIIDNDYEIKKLYAKDAMIKPILIYSDDETQKILKKLKKENINTCIVVDKNKKYIGNISDNDIIKLFLQQVKYESLVKLLNHGYKRKFLYKTAKDLVNNHKSYVNKNTPINEVLKIILKEEFEYIPVLKEDNTVVGVITPSSLINLLKDY
jgi:osmoprotectant transport system ATP-binding protein